MSARTKDPQRPFQESRIRRMPTPTLAKVKRPLSASDTTYVVSEESRHLSDLSHQRERNIPNNNLSEGYALLTDKSRSAYTHRDRHDSVGNDMPIASRGTAVRTNDAPRQRCPKKEEADNTSQQSETASTQSISSVSSSSRSSRTTWTAVANAPEKTESKESEHSARTTTRLEPLAAVSTAGFSTCVETGEASISTEVDGADTPAHRRNNPIVLADPRQPFSRMRNRETNARDPERPYAFRTIPRPKKHSTQASAALKRELDTVYADEPPRNEAAKESPSRNGSNVFVKVLRKPTPQRKRMSEKASPERAPSAATRGDSDVATRTSRHSKEQCSLTPDYRMRCAFAEVPLQRCSGVPSLSLNSVVEEQQKGSVPEKGIGTFYVTDVGGPFDASNNPNRNDQPQNSWGKPETVVRSSYKSKTWKYSEAGHLRHEDPSNAQEENEEHGFIRVRNETMQFKECLLYPLAFCLLMVLTLVGTFLLLPMDPSHMLTIKGFNSVCVSYSCLRDASYLNTLLSWDRVDPCVDFYAFVCDHWTSQHTASTPTSFPETFGEDYAAFLENKIYSMINNKSLETHSLRPIRQLYEKCANVERTDEEGWDTLLELLFDVSLEGFPLTPPVRSSKSVWEMAAKVLRKTGSNALFGVSIAAHPLKDVGRDFLSVELPEMLTGSDGIDINDAARLYTEAMFCALKFLKKEYLPPIHALSVVKFASDLEKLVHKVVLTGDGSPVLEVLKAPSELLVFFLELVRGAENVPFSATRSEVVLQFPSVIKDTISLVQETEVHTVMNYLGVRLIAETSPFLPHNEIVDFKSTLLYGKRKIDVPRSQLCIRTAEKVMSPLVILSVLSEVEVVTPLALFRNITRELFKGILRQINTSTHFDTDSHNAIQSLMSAVDLRILRPDWINDPALLERYIDGFPSAANSSGLQYYVESHEHTFLSSLGRSSFQRWTRSVFTTNCWVELTPPTIYVPVLAFHIVNAYGGSVEDEQSSRVGRGLVQCVLHLIFAYASAMANGRQRWLSEQTEKRLLSAEMCINSSSGEPTPPFTRVRDVMTVHYAHALFREISKGKEAQMLSLGGGKVISKRQLFFVNLMLEACERKAQLGITHSKAGQQWATALRNADEFADAYDCRLGSPMNAHKKCAI